MNKKNNKSKSFCAGIHLLVQKESSFLLLKRSANDKYDPNCWDLPGGGIDFGEQPFEAAIREAREEAGIKVKIGKILAVWAMPTGNCWSMELLAMAQYLSGKVKLSPEHYDYKWVSKQKLKKCRPRSLHLQALLSRYKI